MELVRPAPVAISDNDVRSRMNEDDFHVFYEQTARPLRAYLYRMCRDLSRADDLLQESYLRLIQAKLPIGITDQHRRNYLFRIATNLLHDAGKSRREGALRDSPCQSNMEKEIQQREDSARYLQQVTARQRELLWLAYVERFSHKEIAEICGLDVASIAPLLARARQRFSEILKKGDYRNR